MVLIPAGEFGMGMDADQIPEPLQPEKQYLPDAEVSWFENETPRHKVRLDAFYIDIYEVSNAQSKKFIKKNWSNKNVNDGYKYTVPGWIFPP